MRPPWISRLRGDDNEAVRQEALTKNGRSTLGPAAFAKPTRQGSGDPLVRVPLHLLHVLAFDADQPGRAVAPRRVQVALIVEIGRARRQRVVLDPARLAGLSLAGAGDREILGHDRLAARLAVDRPGRAVIVRVAVLGAVVDMAEDAEAELRVLEQHLALGHVVAEVAFDEVLVLQHLLDQPADLLAPFRTGVRLQDAVTFRRKLFETVAHHRPPRRLPAPTGRQVNISHAMPPGIAMTRPATAFFRNRMAITGISASRRKSCEAQAQSRVVGPAGLEPATTPL